VISRSFHAAVVVVNSTLEFVHDTPVWPTGRHTVVAEYRVRACGLRRSPEELTNVVVIFECRRDAAAAAAAERLTPECQHHTDWMTGWVGASRSIRHIISHFRNESLPAVTCTFKEANNYKYALIKVTLERDRGFLVAAARAWNSLPSTVTAASILHSFRRALKTHLFTASFPLS